MQTVFTGSFLRPVVTGDLALSQQGSREIGGIAAIPGILELTQCLFVGCLLNVPATC